MKKNFMMIALASVLTMPVSCTKNELEAPQGPAAGELTFVAYAEGGDSKTTLNDEDGSVAWAIGDQIKFDYELEKVAGEAVLSSVLAEGDIVEGAATFTAALPEAFTMSTKEYEGESRHMYVTYPASIETDYSEASSFWVTVPTVQDGTFAKASIAHAKWDPANPKAPLQFYNLCGLLQIEIADDAARQIVLEASSDLVGNVSVTFTKEGYEGLPIVKAVKEGTKTITVDVKGAGVYYVAVLPGSIENLYVAINDAEGNLLGDRTANNAIPVARKQIRKLGTIGTGFADRYYVKTTADGSGDGSSWDNAADLTGLKALVATNVVKKVYVAAGTYTFSGNFGSNADAAANFSVYGGYPSDATGLSLAGRDIVNNATVFDGGHTETTIADKRIWVIQKGTFLFNGITFQNAYRAATADIGSAVILEGPVNATFTECVFQNNTNLQTPKEGTLGGGALRLASSSVSVFNNCKFLNNTTDYDGGAVYVSSTASATFNNCEFSGNTATHDGGAVYQTATATAAFNDCEFYSNKARYGSAVSTIGETAFSECTVGASEKANVATRGAICLNTSAAGKLLIENSTLSYNSASIGGALYIDKISDTATLEVKGSTFANNAATSATVNQGGGAVGVSGESRSYAGLLGFTNVLFESNTAVGSGGAVWDNGAGIAFTDCSFISNTCSNEAGASGSGGGAVFCNNTSAPVTELYFNRCFFNNNDINKSNWGRHIAIPGVQSYLGMNNCVVRGPIAPAYATTAVTGVGAAIASKGGAVIVNTTMLTQMGAPVIARGSTSADRGYSVINSIVMNTPSSNPLSFSMSSTSEYMNVYSCIYTEHNGELSAKYTIDANSLAGVVRDGSTIPEFGWHYQYQGKEFTVSAPRNTINVFDWSGTLANEKTFNKQTYDTISGIISNTSGVGPAFLEWLGNGAELKKDIRGVSRNTAAMWPGSYEDATATAGLESLNVK